MAHDWIARQARALGAPLYLHKPVGDQTPLGKTGVGGG